LAKEIGLDDFDCDVCKFIRIGTTTSERTVSNDWRRFGAFNYMLLLMFLLFVICGIKSIKIK